MSKDLPESSVEFSTLIELLRWRALHQPAQRAYTYLIDGEIEWSSLTYAELDRRARAIGALLQSCAATGERALLLYPAGLEFIAAFFACLYAGVTAVPLPPPHPTQLQRTLPRLRTVTNDAQPLVVLTMSSILPKVERLFVQAPELQALRWLATDTIPSSLAEEWQDPTVSSDTLALLQYTSGSTAAPKGVMVSHDNLLPNLALIQRCFDITTDSQGVFWLPLYHDMGLIGGVLETLYWGGTSTLMSPATFLQRPLRWLQAISRTKATISGGPNFAYDLCVRKITPAQRASLDLSCWSVAFNGAEPIRPDTLDRFAAAFAPCGFRREAFYPCYGLAEATLLVCGGLRAALPVLYTVQGAALEHNRVMAASVENPDARTLVGCGQIRLEQKLVIVDPDSCTQCPPGQVGEIWVAGPSIAQGYWHRPEETELTFQAYLADSGEGPFLRTGDLGFLHDGELFVTGRLKDLIIIGGRNHYPQDIELAVAQSHPVIRAGCCAAFSVNGDGPERLVVMAEVDHLDRRVDSDEVEGAIRQAVAEQHEVRASTVLLLKAGQLPKTSSGKIQRHARRNMFLAGNLDGIQRRPI